MSYILVELDYFCIFEKKAMKRILLCMLSLFINFIILAQFPIGHTSVTFNDPTRTGGYGSGGGPGRQIQTEIYYPADSSGVDVPVAQGEFPIISFGHGFAMAWSAYENIWEELVSLGYIVAFPRTEGGLFPAPSHSDFGMDLSLVLNRMLDFDADSGSLFFEKLNGKSALIGHSMGGGSSFLAASMNTNVTTLVGLAPAETNPSAIDVAPSVTIPTLVLSGQQDGVTPPNDHHIPMYDETAADCKYFLSILGGAHCYFANSNFNCDFGEGTSSSGISITRGEQQQTMYDAITPWLDFYLKGDCQAKTVFDGFVENDPRIAPTFECNYELPVPPTLTLVGTELVSSSAFSYQWFLDGAPIAGATGQEIELADLGEYSVVITDEYGCSAESVPYSHEELANLNEMDLKSQLVLAPNPTSTDFNIIGLLPNVSYYVVIMDNLGREVSSHALDVNAGPIAISTLKTGVYFVKISAQDGMTVTHRLVKQ